uniref:Uncharacterized protein n=1 Tax=Anguilla anguilla TaxID=7936 RepID=A0A0E9VRY8_ANGAN
MAPLLPLQPPRLWPPALRKPPAMLRQLPPLVRQRPLGQLQWLPPLLQQLQPLLGQLWCHRPRTPSSSCSAFLPWWLLIIC